MRARDRHSFWLVMVMAAAVPGVAESAGTTLAQAAQNRDRTSVIALLKQGADVNAPAADGSTALHWAAHWGDREIVAVLLKGGAKVDAVNRYDATPLWAAATNGNAAVVEMLLKAGASPNRFALQGEPPLMAAARSGSVEAVSALLNNGATVNVGDAGKGQTALMWAVGGTESHPDVVSVLLEHGANPNLRSTGGLTALHFAVRQNDVESVKLLLKAGAKVNDKGPGGTNALLMAINQSYYDLAFLLLENGAEPSAADGAGMTPLHATIRKRAGSGSAPGTAGERVAAVSKNETRTTNFLRALIAKGADVNARTPLKPRIIPKGIQPSSRPLLDDLETAGMTPFWLASNGADLEAMRILHAAGADPLVPTMDHTTALMVAAGLGYATRFAPSDRREDTEEAVIAAVQQLLDWGHDVNAVNDKGQTAMHGAASAASPRVIGFLAAKGARVDVKDGIGRTPVQVADDNRTDKYRSNQVLDPALLEPTYEILKKLSDRLATQAAGG